MPKRVFVSGGIWTLDSVCEANSASPVPKSQTNSWLLSGFFLVNGSPFLQQKNQKCWNELSLSNNIYLLTLRIKYQHWKRKRRAEQEQGITPHGKIISLLLTVKKWAKSRPLLVYFLPFLFTIQIETLKKQRRCAWG